MCWIKTPPFTLRVIQWGALVESLTQTDKGAVKSPGYPAINKKNTMKDTKKKTKNFQIMELDLHRVNQSLETSYVAPRHWPEGARCVGKCAHKATRQALQLAQASNRVQEHPNSILLPLAVTKEAKLIFFPIESTVASHITIFTLELPHK